MGRGHPVIRRLLLCIALAPAATRADEPPTTLAPVSVIGVTPLPGIELPRDRVPAPVQTATSADIAKSARSRSATS